MMLDRATQPTLILLLLAPFAWHGIGSAGFVAAQDPSAPLADVTQERPSASQINTLVRQLGAKTYRARERAELQLEALGLVAFEALLDQRDHEDIEIRLRSRRLVEKLRTRFLREGVEPALAPDLENYAQHNAEQRKLTIRRFATYLPQQAVNELARIARFEENTLLSKLAALAIMKVPYPQSAQARLQRAERIDNAIGFGNREAVRWLRLYASALRGETVDDKRPAELWESMLEDNRRLTDQERNGESSLAVVVAMHRLLGDFHELSGNPALAMEARQRVSGGAFGDNEELVEWMTWLLSRSAWPAVVDLAAQNERRVLRHPLLLYGLAEAHLQMADDESIIDELLEKASTALGPVEAAQRFRTAAFLEDERGMFGWAEREYRHLIKHGRQDSRARPLAAYRLAQMFHGQGKCEAAHNVMGEMLAEIDESEVTRAVVENDVGWRVDFLKARQNLYMACHHRDQGRVDKQKESLERAIELDPTEADVLIAMYRANDEDQAWKTKTMRAIQNASEEFRRTIKDSRRATEGAAAQRNEGGMSLSAALNQLAWLVSNTEGDYTEALRMSKKSLELSPGNAGIMDTLGRCYYSVNDYENAVKFQRWAHQRSPHDGHIHRQLEMFEAAFAESEDS